MYRAEGREGWPVPLEPREAEVICRRQRRPLLLTIDGTTDGKAKKNTRYTSSAEFLQLQHGMAGHRRPLHVHLLARSADGAEWDMQLNGNTLSTTGLHEMLMEMCAITEHEGAHIHVPAEAAMGQATGMPWPPMPPNTPPRADGGITLRVRWTTGQETWAFDRNAPGQEVYIFTRRRYAQLPPRFGLLLPGGILLNPSLSLAEQIYSPTTLTVSTTVQVVEQIEQLINV
ncbi:hypothetical protein Bbelb_284070 [Branchiostoma belcheri]|nr:hypothetical protein Bbelb_284070 [Branchiostoma belcheri]